MIHDSIASLITNITSAKEFMFSSPLVSVFVCLQNNSKSY